MPRRVIFIETSPNHLGEVFVFSGSGWIAEEVEMEARRTTGASTVYKKPFFVNELLRLIQPRSITQERFAELVEESRAHDINTMLTAMTRQIDRSGFVRNLAGVYEDPQDVLERLVNIGHVQLLKIARFDPDMQTEIFDTLKGNPGMTLRALVVLDESQREVLSELTPLREKSPLAMAMRQANETALKEMYKHRENLHSKILDEVVSLDDRCLIYTGEPHICYPKRVYQDAVVEVWQFFFLPRIVDVRLPAPFERHTVGEILERITPKVFNRRFIDDSQYDPRTPSGFMGLLGKVGAPLPRLIARYVNRDEQLKTQVLREETILTALQELYSH